MNKTIDFVISSIISTAIGFAIYFIAFKTLVYCFSIENAGTTTPYFVAIVSIILAVFLGSVALILLLNKRNPFLYFFKMEGEDAAAYKNLGIYYLENDAYQDALVLFKKARAINPAIYRIDELVSIAKNKLAD